MRNKTLIVRDSHAVLNGSDVTHTFLSGAMDIIAADGRTLASISVLESGEGIEVSFSGIVKVGEKLLSDSMTVSPRASNLIRIVRPEYESK